MNSFTGEIIGTFLLILFGNGVVANVLLEKSKGHLGGWIVISFGWAMAVFIGVFVASKASGAHLNPAVTFALAIIGKISWSDVPQYVAAQMIGAMLGSTAVWAAYKQHFTLTENIDAKRAVFCTAPAIRNGLANFVTEVIASFALVLAILFIIAPSNSLGALDALPVALLVLGIGLSLGGPTGYATNPARDLGPRIMHSILPLGKKGNSDWEYAWVPVAGPLVGGGVAAFLFTALK